MKAASAELKANQAAVHEEHGDGLCWEKGKGAGALIKKYKKANPLWRSCTPKTLRNWTRDHAGQSPPAKSVDRKRIFSDEIESKVAEAAIAASKDNRPQTISRIREQLQTLVTGSSLQKKFKNGVVSPQFAWLVLKRCHKRKLTGVTSAVRSPPPPSGHCPPVTALRSLTNHCCRSTNR